MNVRNEGWDRPREPPETDGERGGCDGESGEFVFGLEGPPLRLTLFEDALIVEANRDAEEETGADGDECEGGVLFAEAKGSVDNGSGSTEEINEAKRNGAHDGDCKDDGLGQKQPEGSDESQVCVGSDIGSVIRVLDAE